MKAGRGTRGFTLVELVMVLSVTAIVASIAVWRMTPAYERAHIRRTAATVASDMQYAQMLAAQLRRPVVVIISEPMRSYLIRDASGSTIFRERYLGQDTEFDIDELEAPTSIEIFPTGVVRAASFLIVRRNGLNRHVRISRAGRVNVYAP